MTTQKTVAEYQAAIQAELVSVEDPGTRRTIYDLMSYAAKTEQEAENRELRPRPEGSENAAYYLKEIDIDGLASKSLRNLLEGLLQLLEDLEKRARPKR